MALYTIEPEHGTLHGRFSRDLPPVLTIDSGDTVRYRTIDVTWGVEQHGAPGTSRRRFERRDPERDDGPALCGPVAVRGAMPGMTLAIHVEAVVPASWGWTFAGPSRFNEQIPDPFGLGDASALIRWTLDAEAMIGTDERGRTLSLRPFLGTIGMPANEPGWQSGWTPRATGGNMDCTALGVGSTLYLPVAVPGGLVSVGDGHAAQGDGEVGGSAIECPMERVELRFEICDDLCSQAPRVRTGDGWMTLGFGKDLERASIMALNEMLDLMEATYDVPRAEALALASLIVGLRITQLVNGVVGVHAVLEDGALDGGI